MKSQVELKGSEEKLRILDYIFTRVCIIELERDKEENLIVDNPQERYNNKKGYKLNKYGKGPFCKFKINENWRSKSGVYLFLLDKEVKYVGECENLYERIGWGYGNISPRNCFEGGQNTNCKINNLIYNTYKNNEHVTLYFLDTSNRHKIEEELIQKFKPEWNGNQKKI